jgi:hypothetical protein
MDVITFLPAVQAAAKLTQSFFLPEFWFFQGFYLY